MRSLPVIPRQGTAPPRPPSRQLETLPAARMNVALIHDKYAIKTFWERKIENHWQLTEGEQSRMKNSALSKLRGEWSKRLEIQTKHLKKAHEENMRKARLQMENEA
ncbi:uncharacterized protein LOC135233536 [Anguilla rostrata]|uniref:uncharacterized protein LOC118207033 n=1 Tax=Anguilla anguilla TaxID=7936 RepID=UPI0015ACC2D9|nr:uncharacterized protein LOC118207033 [Anguilla anguilla]